MVDWNVVGIQFLRHKAIPKRFERWDVPTNHHYERFGASPGLDIITLPLTNQHTIMRFYNELTGKVRPGCKIEQVLNFDSAEDSSASRISSRRSQRMEP